jgi:WD40-like Beta Propeller Repeat
VPGASSGSPSASPLFTLNPTRFGRLPPATSPSLQSLPISCTGDVGNTDPVAIVTIIGRSGLFLRDYADEANPQNFCSFGEGVVVAEILDPHHVVISSPVAAVVELPSTQVFELGIAGRLVAVAPDLSQVAWVSRAGPPTLHDSWDAGDVPIQIYPPATTTCADVDTVSRSGAFSRAGHFGYALWNQGPRGATYLNVLSNQAAAFALIPPAAGWGQAGGPRMALWSPVSGQLYYEQQGNVWRWTTAAGAARFRTGLSWIDPTISPDGKRIAYSVRGSNGVSIVRIIDATSGADLGTESTDGRSHPFFLTDDLLWVRGDQSGCATGNRSTFVYDLRDQTETQSSLAQVWATWPATSALGG